MQQLFPAAVVHGQIDGQRIKTGAGLFRLFDGFSHLLAQAAAVTDDPQPDPDLIIRPSGEKRLSNFMMWQSAYAEFVFMDVLWPDFTPRHLNEALWEYAERDRRFGGI